MPMDDYFTDPNANAPPGLPRCADCVWYDKKNDSCDVCGHCVRTPRNGPPVAPHQYELFPVDECDRLRRQIQYYRNHPDDIDDCDDYDALRRQYEYELRMEE